MISVTEKYPDFDNNENEQIYYEKYTLDDIKYIKNGTFDSINRRKKLL
jgi:hypothetical protein